MTLKPNSLAVDSTTTMAMAEIPKATSPSGVAKPALPDRCPEVFIYALATLNQQTMPSVVQGASFLPFKAFPDSTLRPFFHPGQPPKESLLPLLPGLSDLAITHTLKRPE